MRTSLLAVFAVVVACASLGAAQSCDSYTTAGTCTEAAGCGWCFDNLVLTGGSGVCSEGSRDGPGDGATCNLWRYPCSRCFELYNDEETCVQNPDCGWCSSFSYCDVGDADGPTAGSCAAEDWTFGALNDNADETAVDGGGFTSSPAFFAILGGVALLCIGLIVIVAIRVRSRSNSNPYSVKGDRTGDTTVVVAGDNALGNYLKRQISKKGSMIAKGGFGKVYKVKMADGSTIALKVVDADAPGAVMDFHREVSVLTKLTSADTAHPGSNHVIGMRCFCEDPLSVGLEFARRGSVWSYIKDRKVNMKESRRFLADAAFGVLFLHDNGIVHHDIKPQNFLLMDDNRVCVADFGNSEDLRPSGGGGGGGVAMFNPASHLASFASSVGSVGSSSAPKQILGTPQYLAPERYMQAIAGSSAVFNSSVETDPKASDVYSFGVVAWALTTHEKPFEDFEGDVAAEVAAEPSFRPPIPDFVDYSMGSLMERCWAGEPANRPTMQYVCNVLDEERSATTTDNPVFDDGATRVIAPSHPPSILASGMVTASSWSENGGDSVQLESLNTFENDFFDSVVSGNSAPPPIAPRSSGAPPPIAPRASGGPPVVARRPAKPNKPKPAVKPRP